MAKKPPRKSTPRIAGISAYRQRLDRALAKLSDDEKRELLAQREERIEQERQNEFRDKAEKFTIEQTAQRASRPRTERRTGYKLPGHQYFKAYTPKSIIDKIASSDRLAQLGEKLYQDGQRRHEEGLEGGNRYNYEMYFRTLETVAGISESHDFDYDADEAHYFDWEAWRDDYESTN